MNKINTEYDLEIEKIINEIKKIRAKRVCLQFPDGLKVNATEIAEAIQSKTKAEVIIWLGSCFGACDVPQGLEKLKFDLLVQWGHSPWVYKKK